VFLLTQPSQERNIKLKKKFPSANEECNAIPQKSDEKTTNNKEGRQDFQLDTIPGIDRIEGLADEGYPVAAYSRVSTKDQLDGESIPCQESEHSARAKEIGASLIYHISDLGKTGRDFNNRKLGLILQLARAGKIKKLIVSDIDRIGRKTFQLMLFLFQLKLYDVTLVTHTDEFDVNNLANLIVVAVKAAGAEDENNIRGRVSQRSNVRKFQNGIWNQGKPPVGYQKKEKWIEKVPGWDPVIKEIFTLFLRYKNYNEVTYWVNKLYGEFLRKQIGHDLTRQQITSILMNPIYVGRPQLMGKVVKENYTEAERTHEDSNLAYDIKDLFLTAQNIIKIEKAKRGSHESVVKELIETFGLDIMELLSNVAIICPNCPSKSPSKMGTDGFFYKCPKCKTHLNAIKKNEIRSIIDYALNREKALQRLLTLSKREKWDGSYNKKLKKIEHELEKNRRKISRKTKNQQGDNS
jgi:DNA invertase Pin-like site-specific DNA recombinase